MISRMLRHLFPAVTDLPEALPPHVGVYRNRWVPALGGWLSGMRQPAAAVTLGDAILIHPDVRLTPGLLRHELAHVRQWQQQPLTFPVRYVLRHLQYGYEQNPYEVEARAAELNGPPTNTARRPA